MCVTLYSTQLSGPPLSHPIKSEEQHAASLHIYTQLVYVLEALSLLVLHTVIGLNWLWEQIEWSTCDLPPPSTTSCPPLAACSLQCYCHFDPGESGILKPCAGPTCNVTRPDGACIYLRSKTDLRSGRGTTITAQYGCDYVDDSCTEFENERALLQCCYTDFCNQNFSKLLQCELTENVTMTATTVAPASCKEG